MTKKILSTGKPKPAPVAFRPFLFRADFTEGLSFDNISMVNPGFWNLVPVHSQHVRIANVNVSAKYAEDSPLGPFVDPYSRTPNTDGFEPMWTTDVHVSNCRVLNGDDCITIKSGSSDVLVEDLYCEHGDGLTIGSVYVLL